MANVGNLEAHFKLDSSQFMAGVKSAQDSLSTLSNSVKAVGVAIVGYLSVSAIKSFVGEAIHAATEQEDATTRMNVALASASSYSEKYSKELEDLAGQYQKNTVYGDEMIQGVFSQLLLFGAQKEQIKGLTDTVIGLASGLRVDLSSATDLVTKALAGNTTMLGKYGIHIDNAMTKTETMAELQRIVSQRFGNLAAGEIDTYTGRIKQMNNAHGDFLEEIGNILIKSPVMIELLEKKKERWAELAEVVKKNVDNYLEVGKSLVDVSAKIAKFTAEAVTPQSNAVIGLKSAWYALGEIIKPIVGVFDLLALTALSVAQGLTVMSIPIANIFDGFKSGETTESVMKTANAIGELSDAVTRDLVNAFLGFNQGEKQIDETVKKVTITMSKASSETEKYVNAVGSAGKQRIAQNPFFDDLVASTEKVQESLMDMGQKIDAEVWSLRVLLQSGLLIQEDYESAIDNINLRLADQGSAYGIILEKSDAAKSIIEATTPAIEKMADEKKKISELYALDLFSAQQMLNIEKDLTERTRKARLEQLKTSESFFDNVQYGLLSLRDDTNSAGDFMQRTFKNVFESMEDGIAKFVTTGQFQLSDLKASLISIEQEIIKMTIRKTISEPASEGIASLLMKAAPIVLSLVSSGGASGAMTPGQTQVGNVTPPTVYTPTGPMTPASMRDMPLPAPDVRPLNINMTVNTPDANGFMRNQGDIVASMNRAMASGRRNL